MPPAKKIVAPDDSSSSSKQVAANARGKKPAGPTTQNGSNLKDATNAEDVNASAQASTAGVSQANQSSASRRAREQDEPR